MRRGPGLPRYHRSSSSQSLQLPLLVCSALLSVGVLTSLLLLTVRGVDLVDAQERRLERAAAAAWQYRDTEGGGFLDARRSDAVRAAMLHAWRGYEKYSWGMDEVCPESKRGKKGVLGGMNGFSGLGASMIDAMSTLHVMGLHEEFERAHAWVAENMTFNTPKRQEVSFFETTIRVLGGLMAAHDLSGARLFRDKAEDLAQRLLPIFQSPTGLLRNSAWLPYTKPTEHDDSVVLLAEAGTNLIELGALAARTGNMTYRKTAEAGMRFLHAKHPDKPLLGTSVGRQSGRIIDSSMTVGAPADSYFEYLLKYWILRGKRDNHWRDRWVNASDTAMRDLVVRPKLYNFTFTGERLYKGGTPSAVITHLGCFYPGNVALGVISGAVTGDKAKQYLDFAGSMMHACYQLYNSTKTGLGADHVVFGHDGRIVVEGWTPYLQRPEVVESLFYLWRATHDIRYREWGWEILQAIERHCRKEAGYSGSRDVEQIPTPGDDVQQSWFLAETLKYLYLLYTDDTVVPLDQWVFNTEAHPVRVEEREVEAPWVDWSWWDELIGRKSAAAEGES